MNKTQFPVWNNLQLVEKSGRKTVNNETTLKEKYLVSLVLGNMCLIQVGGFLLLNSISN